MSGVAVMPMADYVGVCDSIREKTGENAVIKSGELAEQVGKIYESGKNSMIDESKIIEKTASGIGSVTVDDVSEIPHKISVQLSSDTITDFSGVKVSRFGKNLFDKNKIEASTNGLSKNLIITNNGFSFQRISANATSSVWCMVYLTAGTYYIKGECSQSDGLNCGWALYDVENAKYIENNSSRGTVNHKFTVTESKIYKLSFYCNYSSVADTTATYSNIQLEKGTTATEYEPFTETTYSANADGTVEGITSISPYMTLQSDIENVSITMTYHKSWGMQTEYDRFWDNIQDNGNRTDYSYGFSGAGWNNESFNPKYSMTPTNANTMFRYSQASIDLVEFLNSKGIVLDFSQCTNFQNTFYSAKFSHIGVVDMRSSTTTVVYTFLSCSAKTIDKIICDKKTVFGSTAFTAAMLLENLIMEGELSSNFDVKDCPLNKASILSIFTVLSDTSTSQTLTLKQSAVNTAFETSEGAADGSESEEWLNLVATKPNWTISLA